MAVDGGPRDTQRGGDGIHRVGARRVHPPGRLDLLPAQRGRPSRPPTPAGRARRVALAGVVLAGVA
ncbi:hypothetical protein NKG94_11190 [Micromonospora sp. M12]